MTIKCSPARYSRRKVLQLAGSAAGSVALAPAFSTIVRAAPPPPTVITPELVKAAEKEGIDPEQALRILMGAAASSWMLGNRGPRMVADDGKVNSAVDIFVKDLGIVLDTGRSLRFPLPVAAAAHQQFLGAAAAGHGREDDSAVVKVYETLAGIEVKG